MYKYHLYYLIIDTQKQVWEIIDNAFGKERQEILTKLVHSFKIL